MIGTKEAIEMLGISKSRLCLLLRQGRIPGATKKGRVWMIPLKNGKLKIINRDKGPVGKWMKGKPKPKRKSQRKSRSRRLIKKIINVNTILVRSNCKTGAREPVIRVKIGSKKPVYTDYVEVGGPCRLTYDHDHPKEGAKVWLETFAEVKFTQGRSLT
jgi:hypothetical protein